MRQNLRIARRLNPAGVWKMHKFACDYVAFKTANKEGRSFAEGYRIKKVGDRYVMVSPRGVEQYAPMDASTTYAMLQRGRFGYLARQADDLRIDILMECSAETRDMLHGTLGATI